jgi:hypothetical protein
MPGVDRTMTDTSENPTFDIAMAYQKTAALGFTEFSLL